MFSIDVPIAPRGFGGRRAVVADQDAEQRATLSRHLNDRGFQVSEAASPLDVLSIIGSQAPSVAFLSRGTANLEQEECERTVALASMLYPRTRIVLTADSPLLLQEDGCFTVLTRPVRLDQLDRCLEELVA